MTEEQAKTKWCPFARTVEQWPEGPTYPRNRVADGEKLDTSAQKLVGCQCIGSACMAWRWDSVGMQYAHAGYGGREPGNGHCGLAGAP